MHPSLKLLGRIAGAVRSNHQLIDTVDGSGNTSFESVMDIDKPNNSTSHCCGCLHRRRQDLNKNEKLQSEFGQQAITTDAHRDGEADSICISSCHSIGSGWFSPNTGKVVLDTVSTYYKTIESKRGDTQKRLQKLNNPFHITVDGYSEADGNIILSAEQLLRQMHFGEDDGITENVQGKLLEEHDSNTYYGSLDQLKLLELGGVFYSFTCRTWMTPYEREMVKTIANMSCFEDETRDNYVPNLNIEDPDDVSKYTYVLQKASYILPGVKLDDITPEVLSSNYYHECCQPVNGTKIWDHWEDDVFRFTRPIIPHIYKMTIQFKVSQVGHKDLVDLSYIFGVRVDKAILMERTKRSVPPKLDGTAKAKSVLCYTAIPGGLLVTHATVILNTAIPTVVAKVIHTFGKSGLAETCETAERTRLFFFRMQ
jgi:hypothetical protein